MYGTGLAHGAVCLLRACYAMPVAHGTIGLRACYAMSGTDLPHAATSVSDTETNTVPGSQVTPTPSPALTTAYDAKRHPVLPSRMVLHAIPGTNPAWCTTRCLGLLATGLLLHTLCYHAGSCSAIRFPILSYCMLRRHPNFKTHEPAFLVLNVRFLLGVCQIASEEEGVRVDERV
eukprot:3417011-Rhodomonas_salina.1